MSASASVVGSDDTAPVGALAAQEDLDDMVREATEEELHEADNDATQAVDNDVQPGLFLFADGPSISLAWSRMG